MILAVVNNPRCGDLVTESLMLRVIHFFHRFEHTDILYFRGEIVSEAGFPGIGEAMRGSVRLRRIRLNTVWPADFGPQPRSAAPEIRDSEQIFAKAAEQGGPPAEFSFPDYRVTVYELDGGVLRSRRDISMVNAGESGLIDFHMHTELAYCGENMNMKDALRLAGLNRLRDIAFVEHSGQLYYTESDFMGGNFRWGHTPESDRMAELRRVYADGEKYGSFRYGLEVDADNWSNVVLRDTDRDYARIRLGAIHFLPHGRCGGNGPELNRHFMERVEALLKSGVDILAHPLRIFAWSGLEKPEELYEPLADLLKKYGVAAEVNFHSNSPEPEFFDLCVRKGVKISLGSDSHNLYEVGFLYPHIRFLKQLGVWERRDEVLYHPTAG